ncbi:MAG: DNA polymerase [Myxococcaceae bacterium]|nr:DNA polymerase [Myxococcaceae bacterium]
MTDRVLIASATNLLARGFQVVPVDRVSKRGAPVNGLYAVARALTKAIGFKAPTFAIAVIDPSPKSWPEPLESQRPRLAELCRALGLHVVESADEFQLCASYAAAALKAGCDVMLAGVDKRYAQLVGEKLWWFDANKDVRYTPEIVEKRFGVRPALVASWLAMVGDDDQLPGVKGVGAKGATEFLLEHGRLADVLPRLAALEGRVVKALKADPALAEKLTQATLSTDRALPVTIEACAWSSPATAPLNALYDELRFSELLVSEEAHVEVPVLDSMEAAERYFERASEAVSFAALLDDPSPAEALVGLGLWSSSAGGAYVTTDSPAWPRVTAWLEDERREKQGHDVVGALVALRRLGVTVRGLVSDSACLSHLTNPSNWATHELWIVARLALGLALPDDDEVRGVGQGRKAWRQLAVQRAASIAVTRAHASAQLVAALSPTVRRELLAEYLALTDTLVRMELTGVGIDAAELQRAEASFAEIETGLEAEITRLAGHPFNINSSKQLGEVLFAELKLPVVSHTRTGWSTANEALERIADAHPIVPLVMRWRGLRRLRDSWLISLRKCIDADGRVHSRFHLARSFAGDLINTNPDLGRVPGRTPEMARVRRAFVARPGWKLMSVDFNQLGLHVLAHLTKDPALVEPLKTRSDMHRLTAAAILEKAPDAVTYEERQLGKVVNFATFAGQGASALGMQLGLPAAQAREYIERFDKHYAKVRAFQDEQHRLAKERGFVELISGRRWPIGGLESLDSQLRSYAERLSRRATHEGSVADVSRRALLRADEALQRSGLEAVPLVQILDEVLFEVPDGELERAAAVITEAMRSAYELEVPLVVGVEAGPNWADLTPVTRPGD